MLEPRLRFMDLATRPLAEKGAAEDLARGEMMDRLAHASPAAGDDTLESATARLEQHPPGGVWKKAATGFVAVLLLCVVVTLAFASGYREMKRLNGGGGIFGRLDPDALRGWEERLAKHVDAGQKMFLLGNTQGLIDEEVNQWLQERFLHPPDDPAEFEEIFIGSRRHGTSLPDRYREHGKRIDPGNGLWALIDAASSASSFSSGSRSRSAHPPSSPPTPEYLKARDLLEEAVNSPRIETYGPRRTAERLRLLGPAEDLAGIAERSSFFIRQKRWGVFGGNVGEIWHERARELASLNDIEGFRKWTASWDRLAMDSLRPSPDRSKAPYPTYVIPRTAKTFRQEAVKLHLADVEARMQKWEDEIEAASRPAASAPGVDTRLRAGVFTGASYFSGIGNLVTLEELEPGLKTEHAVTDRFSALVGATLFAVLAVLAFLEGWRRALPVRGLGQGLLPLFRPIDYAWVTGLGIVLPLLWYIVLMRFTPLGCRDLSFVLGDAIPLFGRLGAALLFSFCMLLQTARWRMAKRGGFIGLRPPALWPGWLVASLAALFIPATGLVRYWPALDEEYLACACAVLGVPLLWLLWRAGSLAFGPRNAALSGILLCRFLLPVLLLASAVLLGLMPLLKLEEKKWVARDKCSGPDPSGWGYSILSTRAEDLLCQRLLKAME